MVFAVGSLTGLVLTACPLTDKYYVENAAAGGTHASSNSSGSTNTESGSGGAAGDGSATESGGTAGTSSVVATECEPASCEGTCCSGVCVDLQSDAGNCGECGTACPAGRYCRGGECYGWASMSPPPAAFAPREKAAYVVMGETKLFIFGGLDAQGNALNTGAIYDVPTDTWTLLPQTDNVPSPRQLATAVWTGLRTHVMGGRDAASALSYTDGARYDPETNSWLALPPLPLGRVAPWAMPTVNFVLLWGGLSASETPLSGGERYVYSASTGSWASIATSPSTPDRVSEAAWGTTDSFAYLFGGRINGTTKSNRAFLYNSSSNSWSLIPTGPSARWGAFGTSDGTAFFMWGGRDDTTVMNDGYRYGAAWTTLSIANAPSARWAPYRRTGWAFAFDTGDIAIVGGMDLAGIPLTDGARYSRATDSWVAIPAWQSQEAHEYGVAALIDGEIIVWGGRNGAVLSATGERYLPSP